MPRTFLCSAKEWLHAYTSWTLVHIDPATTLHPSILLNYYSLVMIWIMALWTVFLYLSFSCLSPPHVMKPYVEFSNQNLFAFDEQSTKE